MLFFRVHISFALHAATVFSIAEDLFSDDNAQSLSGSLFTSEDLQPFDSIASSSAPGNLSPTDLFQLPTELGDAISFNDIPTLADDSFVPAGSQDALGLISDEDMQGFANEALFSGDNLASNECELDTSQIQGRIRARGATCSGGIQENRIPGSFPQNDNPPEGDNEPPEPSAGGNVVNWDKTCANNEFEKIMICSSDNPNDDLAMSIPIPTSYFSLDRSSQSRFLSGVLNPRERDLKHQPSSNLRGLVVLRVSKKDLVLQTFLSN